MAAADAPIAAVKGMSSASVQRLFVEAIARWQASRVRVAGVIEETHGLDRRICSAGVLSDIVSGQSHSIYLETPPAGTACHIDARGAEGAGAAVLAQIRDSDLVILSKFGKLEAQNGGLIHAFEAAIEARKPLLTTVSDRHRAAWSDFAPRASVLPPTAEAIEAWWTEIRARVP